MDINTFFTLFTSLFFKIIPLYLLVFLGYLAGRFIGVTKESVALMLIYTIVPVVVFSIIVNTPLTPQIALLPILFWCLGSIIAIIGYNLGKIFLNNKHQPARLKNILALASGSGNTGYFGLPIVLILFGEQYAGTSIIMGFGLSMFENSLGFYLLSRGEFNGIESLKRILKLPFFYAFILGVIFNLLHFKFSPSLQDFLLNFRGAFTVCGMMLIGLGISSINNIRFNLRFITISFGLKFILWPLLGVLFIWADNNFFHLFSVTIYHVIILMTIVPMPVNSIAFAIITKSDPEIVGVAVLLSTFFALFYIPLIAAFF